MVEQLVVVVETTDEAAAAALRDEAEAAGGTVTIEEREGTALAPLLVIAVIGAAAVVARYLLQGDGRVIDITGDRPVITTDKSLRPNEILFVVPDGHGKATYRMESAPESDLVSIINSGVKGAAAAIVGFGGTKVA